MTNLNRQLKKVVQHSAQGKQYFWAMYENTSYLFLLNKRYIYIKLNIIHLKLEIKSSESAFGPTFFNFQQ